MHVLYNFIIPIKEFFFTSESTKRNAETDPKVIMHQCVARVRLDLLSLHFSLEFYQIDVVFISSSETLFDEDHLGHCAG